MKRVVVAVLLLAGCHYKKSPEEIQKEQEALERWNRAVAAVQVTKDEPKGCGYLKAIQAIGLNKQNPFIPGNYEQALADLRVQAVTNGANTAVIDDITPSQGGQTGDFRFIINSRLYRCPS